jgi:HD-GYP domain-containing protein (c-di-GMP phosphodiesterase class II)
MMAKSTLNAPPKFLENLYIASLLHDIGKIGISENILMKRDPLSHEEFEIMKTHSTRGAEILSPLADFEGCVAGIRHHHERYDGSGYPDGIKGEDIPIIAAIIAVADTFDAMTSDRPYRQGHPKDHALHEIRMYSGIRFNPRVVDAMVELYEKGEI